MLNKQLPFMTVINCIDGRTHLPIMEFICEKFEMCYLDLVTEPGPAKVLAELTDQTIVASIKRRVEISFEKHNSKVLFVAAHDDCAANPVFEKVQRQQILAAIQNLKKLYPSVQVYGLWVSGEWQVQELLGWHPAADSSSEIES